MDGGVTTRDVLSRLGAGIGTALAASFALSCAPTTAAPRATPVPQTASAPQAMPMEPQNYVAAPVPPTVGLADLEAMTFGCPTAGLNAAAREAAKAPSQGTYQFSYFRLVSDSHHASYEVHFKSNFVGEPDLKYCVAVYCQQGWDPKTAKTSVRVLSESPKRTGRTAHESDCSASHLPLERGARR